MKKVALILTVLFATFQLAAQDHLSFKGIPITGSMTEFCEKLQAKGFIPMGSENNISLFSGDFTGKESTVAVSATDDGNNDLQWLFSLIQWMIGACL